MSEMSDLDQAVVAAMIKAKEIGVKMLASDCEAILQAAKQSMQRLEDNLRTINPPVGTVGCDFETGNPYVNWSIDTTQIVGAKLYTHAPDSAAEIARLTKELEEAKNKFSSLAVVGFYNFKLHRFFDDVNEAKRYGHYKPVFSAIDAAIRQIGGAE